MFEFLKILIRTGNFFSLALNTGQIYSALNWVDIGLDNGLSPGRRQAIM